MKHIADHACMAYITNKLTDIFLPPFSTSLALTKEIVTDELACKQYSEHSNPGNHHPVRLQIKIFIHLAYNEKNYKEYQNKQF